MERDIMGWGLGGWFEMPRMAPKALRARVDIHISPLTTETEMVT